MPPADPAPLSELASRTPTDRTIRALRPPKARVDPNRPLGWRWDEERRPGGALERALTVFLTGAECPFTCGFCDLWRHTLDGPTPLGLLPRQLRVALDEAGADGLPDRVKLYNASNFFDRRAVPLEDHAALAALTGAAAVTVESHARTIHPKCRRYADRLGGRLEIAIGLETIHPGGMARLNKRMSLEDFDRAADLIGSADLDLRVFVLLGPPGVPLTASVEWTVRTVEHAVDAGAAVVSVIPTRGGNGVMDRLLGSGEWVPPTIGQLEEVMDLVGATGPAVITADLWDLESLITCRDCGPERARRLELINVTGQRPPRVCCPRCGGC